MDLDEWEEWGFIGPPETGFDYSWIHIQDGLNVIGHDSTITNCRLYYSSRKKFLFLVEPKSKCPLLWSTRNLEFSYMQESENFLTVCLDARVIHLINVSTNFVRLLVKFQKIQVSDYLQPEIEKNVKYEDSHPAVVTKDPNQTIAVDKIYNESGEMQVRVSGTGITRLVGWMRILDEGITIESEDQNIQIDYSEIETFRKVTLKAIFFVITKKDQTKYEIGFISANEDEIQKLNSLILKYLEPSE